MINYLLDTCEEVNGNTTKILIRKQFVIQDNVLGCHCITSDPYRWALQQFDRDAVDWCYSAATLVGFGYTADVDLNAGWPNEAAAAWTDVATVCVASAAIAGPRCLLAIDPRIELPMSDTNN